MGAGDQCPAPRALRPRQPGQPGDRFRRRHRDPDPRHRCRTARRRPGGLRARRDRRDRHPRGGRIRAVRQPVPRVRRPRAAAATPRPGPAQPVVAAAAARRGAARGGRPLSVVPDRARDRPRGAQRRLRPAEPDRPAHPGAAARGHGHRHRDERAVAVRPDAAVRLRRPVRLRGRLPHRRAPRRRAHPRPGPARRAARPGGAARAARPRRARRGRGRAAAGRPRPAGP